MAHRPAKQDFGTINQPMDILGENPPIPPKKTQSHAVLPDLHDGKNFKPGGNNTKFNRVHDTIDKFPPYQPNPPKELKRKIKVEGEEERPGFKLTYNYKSRPTPSIAVNYRNLKASFPSSFRI